MEEGNIDSALVHDIKLLSDLLNITFKEQEGEAISAHIGHIRTLSKNQTSESLEDLSKYISDIDLKKILPITKAFLQLLNFTNIAEQYHRIRKTRWYKQNKFASLQPGSLQAVIPQLLKQGISQSKLHKTIENLHIELVLTAHPTEIKRRTLINKYNRVCLLLEKLDREDLTQDEKEALKTILRSEMTAIWQTNEFLNEKPTALDEAKWGLAVIENSLWDAIPSYLRKLDHILLQYTNRGLPLNICPIKFGSWMGGDRDGNPNVTAKITQKTCLLSKWKAIDLYIKDIQILRDTLSMSKCNKHIHELAGNSTEPYRVVLKNLQKTLEDTRDNIKSQIETGKLANVNLDKQDLLVPLLLCYQSLVDCNASIIANGYLTDVIRRVECFGLSLLKLDLRQDAQMHSNLMTEITQHLGLGLYQEWTEVKKQEFLSKELMTIRPLISPDFKITEELQDVLDTFYAIHTIDKEGLGKYIISMTAEPSDVLVVMLLQKITGNKNFLPVVPLFEREKDLQNAANIFDQLLSNKIYFDLIEKKQEIMIGYSDSAKDVGILAASWSQYQAQEKLLQVAKSYGVELSFFHGRGGSAGRGGWPTHAAILSLPPGTVNGRIRVTQQGEVISNRFGIVEIAKRTLAVYTTATLQASLIIAKEPKLSWKSLMNDLSRVSMQKYQEVVKDNPDFYAYFNCVTPIEEIGNLTISSRPARRNSAIKSVENLRAIPWVFAWTQNRLILPSWLGVGTSIKYALDTKRETELKEMLSEWPFFSTMVSMIEMVYAKSDLTIANLYSAKLLNSNRLLNISHQVADLFNLGLEVLRTVCGKDRLLANNLALKRSINTRSPVLLPLHVIQIELLMRLRAATDNTEVTLLKEALHHTIAGIAAGMRNTG
jgi:phosphoenolpyruvate carboxylase